MNDTRQRRPDDCVRRRFAVALPDRGIAAAVVVAVAILRGSPPGAIGG